jgi:hypothetical protein
MIGIEVSITKYISDEPQPGIVECFFVDANGREWRFVEKTVYVGSSNLISSSIYPQQGVIGCEIIEQKGSTTLVTTDKPWVIESEEGKTKFEVNTKLLVEWESGSDELRSWNGNTYQSSQVDVKKRRNLPRTFNFPV